MTENKTSILFKKLFVSSIQLMYCLFAKFQAIHIYKNFTKIFS